LGGKIFHTCPDWPWGSPSLLWNGTWAFLGVQQLGRDIDHPPIWRWGSRKCGAIPLLPLWAPSWPIVGLTLLYLLLHSLIQFTSKHTTADNDTCLSKFDHNAVW